MKKKLFTITALLTILSAVSWAQTARVQAIHNCPDPGAATVDVWLNDALLLDNFDYKEASPYIDAPAGIAFDLSVCAPNSTDTVGAIFRKSFTLANNGTYVVVAGGGLAENGNTAFDLRAYGGLEAAQNQGAGEVSLNVIHGAYDAPMVDIYEVQVPAGELVPDLDFGGDVGSYVDLPAADFDVQVRTQAGIAAAEFDADLTTLADNALIVLATGYLDPGSAVGSEPFGLLAVLPDGTVLPLGGKGITPARLQIIHNCAATDAGSVDVWLNDGPNPLADDFAFRTATAFIDAPAGELFDVSIALPNSTDTVGALFKQTFLLESAQTYIVIASGTVGSGMYNPATPFSLEVITDAHETATTPGNVDVLVWHGATDAPTVDVVETQVGAGTIVDDIMYAQAQGYLDLPAANYDLDIRDMSGNTTLFSYDANLTPLANNAITVLASGFVDPGMNNNGANFGLWVALPTGGNLIELSISTGVEDIDLLNDVSLYPIPADDQVTIQFDANKANMLNMEVLSVDGRVLLEETVNVAAGANTLQVQLPAMPAGYYLMRFNDATNLQTIPLIKR